MLNIVRFESQYSGWDNSVQLALKGRGIGVGTWTLSTVCLKCTCIILRTRSNEDKYSLNSQVKEGEDSCQAWYYMIDFS
jgi:hypothetical protein